MQQINVHEADGEALNWLVAQALGYTQMAVTDYGDGEEECFFEYPLRNDQDEVIIARGTRWKPESKWESGGALIDAHDIWFEKSNFPEHGAVFAYIGEPGIDVRPKNTYSFGPTRLVAGMRCLAASRLGDRAEVPDALAPSAT